jgi:hypothetical protein
MKERITHKSLNRLLQVNSKCCVAAILNPRRDRPLLHGDVNRNEVKHMKLLRRTNRLQRNYSELVGLDEDEG